MNKIDEKAFLHDLETLHIEGKYTEELEKIKSIDLADFTEIHQAVIHFFQIKLLLKTNEADEALIRLYQLQEKKAYFTTELSSIIFEILRMALYFRGLVDKSEIDLEAQLQTYPLLQTLITNQISL